MININKILEEIENNSDTLEIRQDSFINSVIEDYIINQFMELNNYNKFKTWKEMIIYCQSKLYPEIDKIDKEYGKLIIDYYLSNIKSQYKIPKCVTFEILENCSYKIDEIEKEDIEENVYDNNRLLNEINHEHLKNCLVTGATLANWDTMFAEIKNDLDILDPNIYKLTNDFIKYSLLLPYLNVPKKGPQLIAGNELVEISPDQFKIKVEGSNYVIVCHELLKGVYDLMSQKTFPVNLDEYSQKYLRKVTSDLYYERWEWLFCREMYNKTLHIGNTDNLPLYKYLLNVFSNDYKQLNMYLHELKNKSNEQ